MKNRIIKFRGLNKPTKEWKYGYVVVDEKYCQIWQEGDVPVPVDIETVSQFTGLFDCHGKEIYDKDLVKICFTGNPDAKIESWKYEVEAIYQVNIGLFETTIDIVKLIKPEMMIDHMHFGADDYWWDGKTFKINSKYRDGERIRTDAEIEVIGNVWENPELLQKP